MILAVKKNWFFSRIAFLCLVMFFYLPTTMANPCVTNDGYLDSGIGGTGFSDGASSDGIGGTGVVPGVVPGGDDDGVGGTGINGGDGIGGTGDKLAQGEMIFVSGIIHAFGSVCVNGVEIEYTEQTPVSSDTAKLTTSADLQIGQVVDVVAEKKPGQKMPQASRINVRFPIQGQVRDVNPDNKTMKVLGRTVRVSDRKLLASIKPGNHVKVSGLSDNTGSVVASYIARAPISTGTIADRRNNPIPKDIQHVSVQGYVESITKTGRVVVSGQKFNLGTASPKVEVGNRVIISGHRDAGGEVVANKWLKQTRPIKPRSTFLPAADSNRSDSDDDDDSRRGRNRGRGSDDDDRDDDRDNSGKGNAYDDDDRDLDRDSDNSGSGNARDRVDRDFDDIDDIDRDDLDIDDIRRDNSGRGSSDDVERIEIDRIDNSGSGSRDIDRIEIDRIDNSGRGSIDRPDRVEKIETPDKPDRPDKPDNSGSGRPDRPERPDRPDDD